MPPAKLTLDDSHLGLRRGESSGSCLRFSSFNKTSDEHNRIGNRRVLKKSRTIPANAGNDEVVPMLLPSCKTVDRHSMEATPTAESLEPERRGIEDDIATSFTIGSHVRPVRPLTDLKDELQLGNDVDLLTRPDRKFSFSNLASAEAKSLYHEQCNLNPSLDSRSLDDVAKCERKDNRGSLIDNARLRGEGLVFRGTKKFLDSPPISRTKEGLDGKDFQTRLMKSSKIRRESPARNGAVTGSHTTANYQIHRHPSERLHATKTLDAWTGRNSVRLGPLPSKLHQQEADLNSHDSPQPNHRNGTIAGSATEGLDGRHSSESSINDSITPVAAFSRSLRNNSVISLPSKTLRQSCRGWSFAQRYRSYLVVPFIMFLILCFSCLVFRILVLENKVAQLQGLLEGCVRVNMKAFSKEKLSERGFWLESQKGMCKIALIGFGILLPIPFLLKKYSNTLDQLSRNFIAGTDKDAPLSKVMAYRVDILFSTWPYMKPAALLLATVLLICGGGIALFIATDENLSDAMWRSWTYVADSGNHADSEGTWPRIVSVSISFGGMLIFALMLGLISDAISEKVDSLRKGKSEVIESGHTLILGWSDKLGSLLKQLAIANQSLGGGVVVVLSEREKEAMELEIAKLEFDFMGTSVICRSGSPLIMADLKKVSVSTARAIIVLAEVENADQSDARALRVVLSLTGVKEGLKGHIVVEMSDLDNEALVKLVGGEKVETVVAHDVIGRLMIQCARQPGLAQIWGDILGFEKAEFYIKRWPQLDDMRFEDVLISFPDAIPCGVKAAAEAGRIILNPVDDYILAEGDEILVIAEDDDTYAPAPLPQVQRWPLPKVVIPPTVPEKVLFCGWRRDIHDMIKVLDAFLAPGSELWIFSDVPESDREKKLLYGNLDPKSLENIELVHREGNTVIRRHLESLPLEEFDSILILADEKLEDTVVNADSSSLATLLLIRDIQSKRLPLEGTKGSHIKLPGHSQSSWIREMHEASDKTIIISEILDSRTKNLVSVSKISDYVLSNELVSMALAMVAEDKQINRVLEELFAEEGNELYIRPAEFYLSDQEVLSFFEIMIRARQRDEIVIGYRRGSADQAVINPPDKAVLQRWSLTDVFVVLAFEE